LAQLIFNIVMVLLVLIMLRIFERKLAGFDSSEDRVQDRKGDRGEIAA
jgi:hypothetical protein